MNPLIGFGLVAAGIAGTTWARGKSDLLTGGKADAYRPRNFNKKQLSAGTKVEMEHTNDRQLAREIAMDHLSEDKNYYKALAKMERKLAKKRNRR